MNEIKKSIEVLTDLLKINATGERYNLTRKQILSIFQAIKCCEAQQEAVENKRVTRTNRILRRRTCRFS